MTEPAIVIENLSKRYQLGASVGKYRTLGETMSGSMASRFRSAGARIARRGSRTKSPPETIWALRDVSFDVERGRVLGMVGPNGAGKSTLLKILSRITEPTEGHADIYGRVGSLLEVGTGFHQELTGSENIYLNGAILGMRRSEIARKFDEIVAFAEVEKFVDTPVKRYSTGMHMRLAFAVAAHLEPEILLVDEVLAVGDAAFQKKCLGKMNDVASEGRTVVFVSHQMAAIRALCSEVVLIKGGRVEERGEPDYVLGKYLAKDSPQVDDLTKVVDREGTGPIRFTSLEVLDDFSRPAEAIPSGTGLIVRLSYDDGGLHTGPSNLVFHVYVSDLMGERLFTLSTRYSQEAPERFPSSGVVECRVPRLPVRTGQYQLSIFCKSDKAIYDGIRSAATLTVLPGDFFGSGKVPAADDGTFYVDHRWEVKEGSLS